MFVLTIYLHAYYYINIIMIYVSLRRSISTVIVINSIPISCLVAILVYVLVLGAVITVVLTMLSPSSMTIILSKPTSLLVKFIL